MPPSESNGDVHRLHLKFGEHGIALQRMQQNIKDLTEQLALVTSRVVNLEPTTYSITGSEVGNGNVVDITALGDVYTDSPLIRNIFDAEGKTVYNRTNADKPGGFARGKFPEDADVGNLMYVCGDDYAETSDTIYRDFLYPVALHHAQTDAAGVSLYMTRCGRERTGEEIQADVLQLEASPSVLVEMCAYKTNGYASFLLAAVMLAHGRKTFVVYPDTPQEMTRWRSDILEVNYAGPRTELTERIRQLEMARLMDALLGGYKKYFEHRTPRVIHGVKKFATEIAPAYAAYIAKKEDPVDYGFCAAWYSLAQDIDVRSDVGLIFKAIMTVILTGRGAHVGTREEYEEHVRILFEMKNNPITQTATGRNVELKQAFICAWAASSILSQTLDA